MGFLVSSDKDYQKLMGNILQLMDKGEVNLSDAELDKLRLMAVAAEKYEDEILNVRPYQK